MLAIIGGSGLTQLSNLAIVRREVVRTPYGEPSGALTYGSLCSEPVVFLARHGYGHTIPPHRVNYRANIWALKQAKARGIVSVASVGSIGADFSPGALVVPDQIIDYTWGRESTFFEGGETPVKHVDFTHPYDAGLRRRLLAATAAAGEVAVDGGVYAATQGPRLETAAEIDRFERDGADVVGMTGMPEAVLARELELPYAALNVVVNYAAGRSDSAQGIVFDDIEATLQTAMARVRAILEKICHV
ncbi:S-methyl-5'-thioinosine phosphorylase [Thauera linaloolentis]|uniref:Probable 6-oxopurine nucleoside phosphorylase n=1 Tax=Thauera linaloolentis (strain DSM 12138 / JCM 21573 / CCUG 41526 / CIP 105981 / IAM 15112 / NBRC 102519 / 47Lol) TaxID=1123367 RepID=N6Z6V6_THAL4|nr:S-methyl-5'-thioinosine phosphorylase [Thauera linaloolentis]ENO90287.1 5'-methylthioadenosine phosphorylase [Thauera linaloolentis 47Lol = DSM 12138]MCM8566224.1 S-methyl-5'-thioinosine phosphorylase [Thauera linaloolentis]